MSEVTKEKKFRATETQDNVHIDNYGRLYQSDVLWFKLLEGKRKKGLEFAIPLEHPEYSDSITKKLREIEVGDEVNMSCESINENQTSWRCESIKIL